jgi:hypothetical protein
MARQGNKLSSLQVEKLVKKTTKPTWFSDGLGLYLMVRPGKNVKDNSGCITLAAQGFQGEGMAETKGSRRTPSPPCHIDLFYVFMRL